MRIMTSYGFLTLLSTLLYMTSFRPIAQAVPVTNRRDNNILLRESVKTLLGYQGLPKRDAGIVSNPYNGQLIPKYMLDLYERYKDRNVPTGSSLANTVRSIYSQIGLVEGENIFIFNLTSVDSTERLLNGEIHLYRKKRRRNTDITVTLYELAPHYMTQLTKYRLNSGKYGWQVFSVTDAVKSCLSARRANPHILAVGFSRTLQTPKSSATKSLRLKSYVRHLSRPYLVVYSNSDANLTRDHVSPRLSAKDFDDTFINPESGRRESFGRKNGAKKEQIQKQQRPEMRDIKTSTLTRVTSGTPQTTKKQTQQSKPVENAKRAYKQEILRRKLMKDRKTNEAIGREKRSIYDNEIPDDPNVSLAPSNKKPTSERKDNLLSQKLRKYSSTKSKNRRKTFKMSDFDIKNNPYSKSQYLQYTKNYGSDKKRRRKPKVPDTEKNSAQSGGSRGNIFELPVPKGWGFAGDNTNSDFVSTFNRYQQQSVYKNKLCKKRKSRLDFADIGWSEWVIAPKSFESNFCAGSCSFPQAQSVAGLSNHATLQSLVHAVGINKNVPAPCCVPAKTASLSLLYFDQNKNIVLKNYPDMSVQTCECQ